MMNPWINYHHLLYFKTIAEEGGISAAAKKLRLGQPTLSAQLKQFEDQLGIPLFERHHKRLVLTEQGRIALKYAQTIFKMGNEMYQVLHDKIMSPKVNVQIGALDSIPKQVVHKIIESALKIQPCHVTVVEAKMGDLIRETFVDQIDLFVANYLPSSQDLKGLEYRCISRKPVGIYGAPQFRGLRKNFPASLNGTPFILPTHDSRLRSEVDHWLRTNGITVEVIVEGQDMALKKLLAAEGLGLIPAAAHTIARQVHMGELIEIGLLKAVHEELYLISKPRRFTNPVAKELNQKFTI